MRNIFGRHFAGRGRASHRADLQLEQSPATARASVLNKPLAVMAAFALVAAGSATALGEGLLASGVAAAADATDVMLGRSPGERGAAATSSKSRARVAAAKRAPGRTQRALPRYLNPRAPADEITSGSSLPPTFAPVTLAPLPADAPGAGPIFGVGGPEGGGVVPDSQPGGFGFLPPTGAGGGGGGGFLIPVPEETPDEGTPIIVPPVVPPVISPVPEPATWAMMILGFGAIGLMARRSGEKARA